MNAAVDMELSAKREDLIRFLLGEDIDLSFIDKVSEYAHKLFEKKVDYYDSPEFYEDLDEAENEIRRGEGVSYSREE